MFKAQTYGDFSKALPSYSLKVTLVPFYSEHHVQNNYLKLCFITSNKSLIVYVGEFYS